MADTRKMATALSLQAGILQLEEPANNQKLQKIVGEPEDAVSTFAQFAPQSSPDMKMTPLGPVQGDQVFFTYLLPGARFQAHDGSWWEIDEYDGFGKVDIHNVWYPRMNAILSVQDIRRSIYAWIEPVFQIVPPPPAGINYGITEVRLVDSKV